MHLHKTFLEQVQFVKFSAFPIQRGENQLLLSATLLGNWEEQFLYQEEGKNSFFWGYLKNNLFFNHMQALKLERGSTLWEGLWSRNRSYILKIFLV